MSLFYGPTDRLLTDCCLRAGPRKPDHEQQDKEVRRDHVRQAIDVGSFGQVAQDEVCAIIASIAVHHRCPLMCVRRGWYSEVVKSASGQTIMVWARPAEKQLHQVAMAQLASSAQVI
jgi:hypothetical protein